MLLFSNIIELFSNSVHGCPMNYYRLSVRVSCYNPGSFPDDHILYPFHSALGTDIDFSANAVFVSITFQFSKNLALLIRLGFYYIMLLSSHPYPGLSGLTRIDTVCFSIRFTCHITNMHTYIDSCVTIYEKCYIIISITSKLYFRPSL